MAQDVYSHTSLRSKASNYDLTGDPKRPGFFLLSIQGRNLHYPTESPRDGRHHDFYFRDLRSPSTNPDVDSLDRFIDALSASGLVDRHRIYVTGWSNGGFFAQMYAIARHETPTPGGQRVAAAAVYSAADPFNNIRFGQEPSCRLGSYPRSTVPILLVGRACDTIACDAPQAEFLRNHGALAVPGYEVDSWVHDLGKLVADSNITRLTVNASGAASEVCKHPPACSTSLAVANHEHWPNGIADKSGVDHELAMLDFMREHALLEPVAQGHAQSGPAARE
jgi:poly(3-hydroxybutyrate) depolymerase